MNSSIIDEPIFSARKGCFEKIDHRTKFSFESWKLNLPIFYIAQISICLTKNGNYQLLLQPIRACLRQDPTLTIFSKVSRIREADYNSSKILTDTNTVGIEYPVIPVSRYINSCMLSTFELWQSQKERERVRQRRECERKKQRGT